MSPDAKVYVAGVGLSSSQTTSRAGSDAVAQISAATKALLEAGVTYDDVDLAVAAGGCEKSLRLFDNGELSPVKTPSCQAFGEAFTSIIEGQTICALVLEAEQSNIIALILVSEDFLWSRPYLKDTAVATCKSNKVTGQKTDRPMHDLCQLVWQLKGWSNSRSNSKHQWSANNQLCFELCRVDGKPSPKWEDIKFKSDGRDRLNHNPANETRELSQYEFDAVRSQRARQQTQNELDFKHKGGDAMALAKL